MANGCWAAGGATGGAQGLRLLELVVLLALVVLVLVELRFASFGGQAWVLGVDVVAVVVVHH